ncbi:MAG: FHA domain-containing protein [Aphanocapsa sp. GSE-SYN-MK-11-07L]|jgi:signal transduction histidine kinase/pSer/pThr/pTyr-binding forkhead associated (FHA) protein|nr:FHA domain-containing protein [Aphanocapsa sp. GSE-SYN-MK-11-07L]
MFGDIESERQQVRHLLVVDDTEGRRPVLLEAATYSIGRDATNSIVLHSKLVSRQHAILLRVTAPESSAYLFRIIDGDLQGKRSTNGLIINGQRQYSHDLKHSDVIVFGGDVKARYYAVSNLSDEEFYRFSDTPDLSGILSKQSNPFQTLVPLGEQDYANFSEAALVRLASYPELTPNPILEIDLAGTVTYLNPAAVMEFPNIQKIGTDHPILAGLLGMVSGLRQAQEKFFAREVEIDDKIFEQSVHYIFESELIRSYVSDITERKRAEEQLRHQAQREAVINRIVQAMRGTLVASEVLQITADLLLQALGFDHCLIVQQDIPGTISAHQPQAQLPAPLNEINHQLLAYYRQQLAYGNQVFAVNTHPDLDLTLQSLMQQYQMTTLVITPMLYLGNYLGSISLYHSAPDTISDGSLFADRDTWSGDEFSLVKTIADQSAIAIHQAQLYQRVQELNADLEQQVQERTAQLQQKMRELEQLNDLKDDFLSTVSHELRTPMANMKMAIHMMKQFPLDERQERYIKILGNECARETELINDLLDLQRLEAGTNPIQLEQITPGLWLPTVLDPFHTRMQQRKQTLTIASLEGLPVFESNRYALERVLVELLNNACKYTPAQGEVSLRVETADRPIPRIQFLVSNPSEIPAAELPRIFDKFYRVPNADPWKQGGTGLGLALVKKMVEQLKGEISVSSQHGQTTFVVALPLALSPNRKI